MKNIRISIVLCVLFFAYGVQAAEKLDGKSPYWVAGVCGKLEFTAWDKFNKHPPYHIKYVVKASHDVYTAEKDSDNQGATSHAMFPDDFVDSKGETARFSYNCVIKDLKYEIYSDGVRIDSGKIGLSYKVEG